MQKRIGKLPFKKGLLEQEKQLLQVIESHKRATGRIDAGAAGGSGDLWISPLRSAADYFGKYGSPRWRRSMVSPPFIPNFPCRPKGSTRSQYAWVPLAMSKARAKSMRNFPNDWESVQMNAHPMANFRWKHAVASALAGLAPVLTVNDEVYGRLTEDDVDSILAKYQD